MNWLKAMLLMVVLGAILYGVNVVLNKSAPTESPTNNNAWASSDGPIAPPVISPGTAGMNNPPGYGSSSYGQTQPVSPANASGNYPAANQFTNPTVITPANPPAYPSSVPPSASNGNPTSVYQPATPPIVNDPVRQVIPATNVGLVTSTTSAAPPTAAAENPAGSAAFAPAMESVMTTLRAGRLAEGLQRLTLMYDDPQLNPEQNKQLNDLLGRLAGTVVYSRQHLLVPAYEVKPGDRLETIADEYQIPAGLLAKINGISDPDHLPPGEKLKVIHGPFMALVSLSKREVTLVVQQCYAGKFPLTGMGKDAAALNGIFKVDRKDLYVLKPPFTSRIGFGTGFKFCGIKDPSVGDDPRALMLTTHDAEDLFDILTVGSSVVVR